MSRVKVWVVVEPADLEAVNGSAEGSVAASYVRQEA
jgi:hypothetical protein